MRGLVHVACTLLLAAAPLFAAPPEAPPELSVKAGKVKEIVVKPDGKKDFGYRLVGGSAAFREMKTDTPGERVFWLIPETDGPLSIVWWTVGEKASAVTEVNKGGKPDPEPKPPEPKPPAPDGPLRVIFVYETGAGLTLAQQAVVFGDKVRAYLDANAKGWRRFDKDADVSNERDADIKALWEASKGKVTAVPCVIVASGGRADIVALPGDPDAALELFRKYGGK